MFSELFARHRRLAFFGCAACFLAGIRFFVATEECKTSLQLCGKICILGGNMLRFA